MGAWVGTAVGSDSHAASAIAKSAIASVAATYRILLLIKLFASRLPARRIRDLARTEMSPLALHKYRLSTQLWRR